MSYLRDLCLFAYSGVQHILCLVYPMLSVSLDCPFLIAPLVFIAYMFSIYICVIQMYRHTSHE